MFMNGRTRRFIVMSSGVFIPAIGVVLRRDWMQECLASNRTCRDSVGTKDVPTLLIELVRELVLNQVQALSRGLVLRLGVALW